MAWSLSAWRFGYHMDLAKKSLNCETVESEMR